MKEPLKNKIKIDSLYVIPVKNSTDEELFASGKFALGGVLEDGQEFVLQPHIENGAKSGSFKLFTH